MMGESGQGTMETALPAPKSTSKLDKEETISTHSHLELRAMPSVGEYITIKRPWLPSPARVGGVSEEEREQREEEERGREGEEGRRGKERLTSPGISFNWK